ncbi:MAG: FAD-binding oxidoreductase [Armatimonas sp.]
MSYSETLGSEPEQVVRPESVEALQEALQAAGTVVALGGGAGQDYGHAPTPGFTLLDLGALNQIVAVEPGDMTITVQCGATLAEVQAALEPHGQWLPLDPPQAETATMGGIIATNAFGPLRLGYGTARDWLVGLSVVDAEGRLTKGGGKVVKNVTGYDLPKLHVGALGTLGVLVEATFKTSPRPEATRTVVVPDIQSSIDSFVETLLAKTTPVQALLHEDETGRTLALVYHGPTEAADSEAGQAADLAVEAGLAASVYAEEFSAEPAATPVAVRLSCLPAQALRVHARAKKTAGDGAILDTQLGAGVITVYWPEDTEEARTGATALLGLGESATLLHGPLELRESLPALWNPAPSSLPLMKAVKASLDPASKLNPGRFLV